MTKGNSRTIQHASFHKPIQITKNNHTTTFDYDADYNRYKRVDTGSTATGGSKTVYYIGGSLGGYEKEIRDGSTYHRIALGDFAIVEKVDT